MFYICCLHSITNLKNNKYNTLFIQIKSPKKPFYPNCLLKVFFVWISILMSNNNNNEWLVWKIFLRRGSNLLPQWESPLNRRELNPSVSLSHDYLKTYYHFYLWLIKQAIDYQIWEQMHNRKTHILYRHF
jgi:hypothetical protein